MIFLAQAENCSPLSNSALMAKMIMLTENSMVPIVGDKTMFHDVMMPATEQVCNKGLFARPG